MTDPKPSRRKPFGVLLLIVLIAIYAVLAVAVAEPVTRLHVLLQLPIWIVLGIAWVFPARPLVRWIETGRFRK